LREAEIDEILAVADRTRRQFREMTDTPFDPPYDALRKVVESGVLGTVVQVFAQKSYPYHDRRPQDEDIDGGLTAQVGVHALRMVELVARQRIAEVMAWETTLGNPVAGAVCASRRRWCCAWRAEGSGPWC
jgi:predicted dehydrogenase